MTRLKSIFRFVVSGGTRGRNLRLTPIPISTARLIAKTPLVNTLYSCLLFTLLVSICASSAHAQRATMTIPIFQPTTGGNERWHIIDEKGNDHLIDLVIDLTPSGLPIDARTKAELVRNEINRVFKRTVARLPDDSTAPNATVIELPDTYGWLFSTAHDGTHERHRATISQISTGPGNTQAIATIDYHLFGGELLAGVDQVGLESQFQSSFGFDGILADASFRYGDLSGNTVDALLTDTYNAFLADLPVAYAANLSLDLLNDEINFALPSWQSTGFVDNFTSDANAFATIGLGTTIPVSSTISLLAVSAVGFRFVRIKRRGTTSAVISKSSLGACSRDQGQQA